MEADKARSHPHHSFNQIIREGIAKMTNRASVSSSHNNNIEVFYFYNFIKDNFYINKHIDLVKYSVNGIYKPEAIYKIIQSIGYKQLINYKIEDDSYIFKATYVHEDDLAIIDIFYELKSKKLYLPPIKIVIHDPNQELIDFLYSSCAYNDDIELKVSEIELAYDFFTDDRIGLIDFLKSCLFLKGAKTPPSGDMFKETFYANDLRKSNKGLKIYIKDQRFVRLELTLKRNILRILKIQPSLKTIDSIDPLKYFTFMSLNKNDLLNHEKWEAKRADKSNGIVRSIRGDQLLERHAESYVDEVLLAPSSLMGKILEMKRMKKKKKLKNYYSRFLIPLEDVKNKFIKLTQSQTFLTSRTSIHNQKRGNKVLAA